MSDNAREIFARNLTDLIRRTGKTQLDIATKLNVSPATVSSWTSGQKFPRIDVLEQLADYFDIRWSLLAEEGGIDRGIVEAEERRLLRAWRNASDEIRGATLRMLEDSASKKEDTAKSAT